MRLNSEFSVYLNLLSENFDLLRARYLNDNSIIFMVKANAYGHGLVEIAEHVTSYCGVSNLGVASLGEAIYLRQHVKGGYRIWVFSELGLVDQFEQYHEHDLIPVISQIAELDIFLAKNKSCPLVLKFNTGMNRLGIGLEEIENVMQKLAAVGCTDIFHLMTHFANSYFPIKEGDRTHQQYEKFLAIKNLFLNQGFSVHGTSVSNSGAIEQRFGLEESHVRPGLMLYGPSSMLRKHQWEGKVISSLKTKLLDRRDVEQGTPIGYGSQPCPGPGVIGYLPLGYGDGILGCYIGFEHSSQGKFVGRINMDLSAVLWQNSADVHDSFALWDSAQLSIHSISKHTKLSPYQIFTAISSRVPRRYYS